MIKKICFATYHSLLNLLYLQIILAFVTTPILIGWGLPISIVGLVSNLIFTPFLCGFLFLASIVFITQLLYIPNDLLLYPIEWCSSLWIRLLSINSPSWLVGCTSPHPILLGAMVSAGIGCFMLTKKWRTELRIACAAIVFGSCIASYCLLAPASQNFTIHYQSYPVTITTHKQGITVLVPHLRTRPRRFIHWVNTQLSSMLYKKIGSNRLWQLIITNPAPTLIKSLHQLPIIPCRWLTIITNHHKQCYCTVSHQAMPAPLSCTARHAVDYTDSPQTSATRVPSESCMSVKNSLHDLP